MSSDTPVVTRKPAPPKVRSAGPRKARSRGVDDVATRVYVSHAKTLLSGWSDERINRLISWIGEELGRRNQDRPPALGLRPIYSRSEIAAGLVLLRAQNGRNVEAFGDLLHGEHRRLVDVERAVQKGRRARVRAGRLNRGRLRRADAWTAAEKIARGWRRKDTLTVGKLRLALDLGGIFVSQDTAARMLKKFRPTR